MIHVAGPAMYFLTHVRQRCMWCGAVIIDQDLSRVSVSLNDDDPCDVCGRARNNHPVRILMATTGADHVFVHEHRYPTWETGAYIEHDSCAPGGVSYVVVDAEHAPTTKVSTLDGEPCMMLPIEATS